MRLEANQPPRLESVVIKLLKLSKAIIFLFFVLPFFFRNK